MNTHCGDDTVVVGGAGRDQDEEDERDVTDPIVVCCERMSALVYLLKPVRYLLRTLRHE